MRVLAGGDSRRGHYQNPKYIFKDNYKHKELAKKFFRWVEAAKEKICRGKNPTARVFSNLAKKLRWLILQDNTVINAVYKRTYCLINSIKSILCSDLFKGFVTRNLNHIKEAEYVKEDTVQDILPGVLNKFDQHRIAINAVHSTLSDHHKKKSIDCIEKTVEKMVEKVVHVRIR